MWCQERDVFVSVFKIGKFSNGHGSLIGYQCIIFMESVQKGVSIADLSPLSLEGATWNMKVLLAIWKHLSKNISGDSAFHGI